MIVLTFAPAGAEPKEFKFENFDDFGSEEAEAVEVLGAGQWRSFGGWVSLVGEGNMRSWRALLWLLLRRENPDLAFNDVKVPRVKDLEVRADLDSDESEPGTVVEEEGKASPTSDEATASE
jgi:hypothetical protein